MTKPDNRQKGEDRPFKIAESQPNNRRGCPGKFLKDEDTPKNVARALWGERSSKFLRNQGNQTLGGAQKPQCYFAT